MKTPRLRHLFIGLSVAAFIPTAACSGDETPSGDGDSTNIGDGDVGDGDTGDGDGDTGGSPNGDGDTGGSPNGDGDAGGGGLGGMTGDGDGAERFFNRVASFPVCQQLDPNCDDDTETVAEIAAVTEDGNTLVYTDAARGVLGYVDIADAAAPQPIKTTDVGGEPTSVAVKGKFALVGVNTSPSFVSPSGVLLVFDTETQSDTPVRAIDLGGQPDSVAVSPDGTFAAVVIENERDEDFTPDGLDEGDIPQLPAGKLVVVDLSDADPLNWTSSDVDLTGLSGAIAPTDPEPEYVDINANNVAVVTLQENNAIAIVDLATATVTNSFSAGTVDLTQIDATEEEPAVISLTESLSAVPREPDGVSWIGPKYFATADEGDWQGGSRGFTIFSAQGKVVFTSGNAMDHWAVALGHYPDARSENKGSEAENVEYAEFGDEKLLFVNSERASLVFVYDVADPKAPVLKQILPASSAPEGGLAIPGRNLLVVSSEADSRDDGIRSVVNIYERRAKIAAYPTLVSGNRDDETPIPWAALSGLAAGSGSTLYGIEDSYFASNRIFTIDTSTKPAHLTDELRIRDSNNVFAAYPTDDVTADDQAFSSADLAAMINPDKTVNIDPEGIAVAAGGGFWVASEGSGTISDAGRPIQSLNLIFKVAVNGDIEEVISLPSAINDKQVRFGFEGVAEYDGKLYVAFQRTWEGDAAGKVRLGIYDLTAKTWDFVFYTLDAPASQFGGWVGLSDITSLGEGKFLIVERDNLAGPDAAIKKLYQIDLSAYTPEGDVTKTAVRDLLPDLAGPGGVIPEKIEGCAVDASGNVWIVNDNDGVEDNSGETQLLQLGQILP